MVLCNHFFTSLQVYVYLGRQGLFLLKPTQETSTVILESHSPGNLVSSDDCKNFFFSGNYR